MKGLSQLTPYGFYSGFGNGHFFEKPFKPYRRSHFIYGKTEFGIIFKIALLQWNITICNHFDMKIAAKIVPGLINQRNAET